MPDPVAIVSGAGKGIGRAAAIRLAQAGYQLALIARTQADLNAVAQKIGNNPAILVADVSDPSQVSRAVDAVLSRFGRIDALVNCAGIAPRLTVDDTTIETWRQVIDTNLSSVFYLSKACWPAFRSQSAGVIVNISSEAARDPFPGFAAYAAAKGGINLLGHVLAREGHSLGIRVHTIAPGAVETEMFRKLASPAQWSPEKTLDPAEIAAIILECISGSLRYTSGEVIWMHKTL